MILLIIHQRCPLSSGARPVLPMGVAPEAIVEIFSGIGSNILSSHLPAVVLSCYFVGDAPSASDGSSPRGYKGGGVLVTFYKLKYFCSEPPVIFGGLNIFSFLPLYIFPLFLSLL
jgi:hypothetical protein